MPTFIAVQCPHCHRDQVVKRGKTARGTQRYLCQNQASALRATSPSRSVGARSRRLS
jgi:transposase-like protein